MSDEPVGKDVVPLQSLSLLRKAQDRLLAVLRERQLVNDAQVAMIEEAMGDAEAPPLHLYLQATRLIPTGVVLETLAEITGMPLVEVGDLKVDTDAVDRVSPRIAMDYHVMPLRLEADPEMLVMATNRVPGLAIEDDLRLTLGCPVKWMLCSTNAISRSIKYYYGVGIEAMMAESGGTSEPDIPAFVSAVIAEAIECGATDIHFEPDNQTFAIRIRIDGALNRLPIPEAAQSFARAVVSHIKALAQLDIADHRKPQDGRFEFDEQDQPYDIRVSILPTPHGEAANLRLLNRHATFIDVNELGMRTDQRAVLDLLLSRSHGMILFTGPTGSGKSTSMYAALDSLNSTERKIITLEDPIEYEMAGVHQMQVNPRIDFTFASGLRSILRHDPDVVMVGEIRDRETAEIAVSAAMTGHVVFSSLHTNDSPSAIPRLIDMGIEPYLVASALEGVIAQRLVRKICVACRTPAYVAPDLLEEIRASVDVMPDVPVFYAGQGCPECMFTGFLGRQAIFEVLKLDDELRSMTIERLPSSQLMQAARNKGMRLLRQSGWELVLRGATSVNEILRVTTL